MVTLSPSMLLAYVVGGVVTCSGIAILVGYGVPQYMPNQVRITFGIVLILLGIYRFVIVYAKANQKS